METVKSPAAAATSQLQQRGSSSGDAASSAALRESESQRNNATSAALLSPTNIRSKVASRARKLFLGDEAKSLRKALEREMKRPMRVRALDKLSFTLGVFNVCATVFIMAAHPDWFWVWYTLWSIPLLIWRYISYSRQRYHYFLLDMCYWVNGLAFLHLFVMPKSSTLFAITFACANGPVAVAIIAWRNSLVFHDLEKVTSVFIHIMPALLTYTQRWHYPGALAGRPDILPPYLVCSERLTGHVADAAALAAAGTLDTSVGGMGMEDGSGSSAGGSGSGMVEDTATGGAVALGIAAPLCPRGYWFSLLAPLGFYILWQVIYYVKTEIVDRHKLAADPSLQTSLRWLVRSGKGLLHDVALKLAKLLRILDSSAAKFDVDRKSTVFIFMGAQLLYTLLTLLPTKLMYDHHLVHGVMLALFAVAATHNGSCFYVEVFSRRYQADIERAFAAMAVQAEQKEQAAAAAATAAPSASAAGAGAATGGASAAAPEASSDAAAAAAMSPGGRSAAGLRASAGTATNEPGSGSSAADTASSASNGRNSNGGQGRGEGGLLQAAGSLLAGGSASDAVSGPGVSYGLDFGALAGGVLVPAGDDGDGDDDGDEEDSVAASVASGSDAAPAAASAPVEGARGGASTIPVVSPASEARRRRGRAASTGAK